MYWKYERDKKIHDSDFKCKSNDNFEEIHKQSLSITNLHLCPVSCECLDSALYSLSHIKSES